MKKMIQKLVFSAMISCVPATIFAGELAYRAMENIPVGREMLKSSFGSYRMQSHSRELLAVFNAIKMKKEDVILDLIESFPSVVNDVYIDLDENVEGTVFLWGLSQNMPQKILDACIIAGADVHKNYSFGNAMSCAIKSGNPELVQMILDAGANVEAPFGENGMTPLMFAAKSGNVESVNVLLSAGANYASETKDGKTALDFADNQKVQFRLVREKKSHTLNDLKILLKIDDDESNEMVKKILSDEKIVPDEESVYIVLKNKKSTPQKVETLLEFGAKPQGKIYEDVGRFRDRVDYYKALLKAGVRPGEKISSQIFHLRNVESDMIFALLKTGAMPNEHDLKQILHSGDSAKILEACLKSGLDPNMNVNRKPLIMSALDNMACVKLLVEHGANVDFMVDAQHSFRDYLSRRKPDILNYINSVKPVPATSTTADFEEAENTTPQKNRNRRERVRPPSRERPDRRANTRRNREFTEAQETED